MCDFDDDDDDSEKSHGNISEMINHVFSFCVTNKN